MLAGSCLCPDSLCWSAKPILPTHAGTGDCHRPASGNPLRLLHRVSKRFGCVWTVCNTCSGRENKYPNIFCVNQQLHGPRPAQPIELVAVVRLKGSRLCCWVLRTLTIKTREVLNTILKADLFTASLNPAHNESPGHALRLNSSDNLTFNLCPQRERSSLPPYLGREENSSHKACAGLWRHEILHEIIQDSWVSVTVV